MPLQRDEKITSADILAMTEAGARAGVLAVREQQVIANVFELDTRLVSSVMTSRDRIAWFLRDDPESVLRARIVAEPFSAYPVCEGDIDHVLGYVDAKDMFQRVLSGQPLSFDQGVPLHKALVIPDRLSLDRGARAVPPGARGLRDHRQRVQPGGGRRSRSTT